MALGNGSLSSCIHNFNFPASTVLMQARFWNFVLNPAAWKLSYLVWKHSKLYENTERRAWFYGAKSRVKSSSNTWQKHGSLVAYIYGLNNVKCRGPNPLISDHGTSRQSPWRMVAQRTGTVLGLSEVYYYLWTDRWILIRWNVTEKTKIVTITHEFLAMLRTCEPSQKIT